MNLTGQLPKFKLNILYIILLDNGFFIRVQKIKYKYLIIIIWIQYFHWIIV